MTTIRLEDEDVLMLKVILMDQDKDAAFDFLREKVLPEIKRQETGIIKNHLDSK